MLDHFINYKKKFDLEMVYMPNDSEGEDQKLSSKIGRQMKF